MTADIKGGALIIRGAPKAPRLAARIRAVVDPRFVVSVEKDAAIRVQTGSDGEALLLRDYIESILASE